MSMTSRERILSAIDRRPVDRIPTDYWGTPEITENLQRHFGVDDTIDLWPRLHADKIIQVAPAYVGPPIVDTLEERIDYWGVQRARIVYGVGAYYEIRHHPLAEYETIDEIESGYTWPSADWFDFSGVAEECDRYPEYAIEAGYMAPFYMFNNIRGFERSLIDLAADPELTQHCEDRICDFLYDYHWRLFESAGGRVHLTEVTDDFGSQHGLLISQSAFRRYFEKPYSRLIGLARQFGIRVFHHDDGAMADLIPDLLRLGIQVLNPIQWRLPGMDPALLKDRYGDVLSFHGGVDNQWVLPFGTPRDVEAEVIHCLSTLGRGGTGYVLAPCHNLQAITPVENVVRMYEAARHEGRI